MKIIASLGWSALLLAAPAPGALADEILVEQVYDHFNGLASERNTAVSIATTADDFTIKAPTAISGFQATFLTYNAFPPVGWELLVFAHDEINDQPDEDDILYHVNGGVATYDGYDEFVKGLGVYTVSFDSLNLPLDAGLYWLGVRGVGTGNSNERVFWGTANSGDPAGHGAQLLAWNEICSDWCEWRFLLSKPVDAAFTITVIPAPPVACLGLAALTLGTRGRRRRAST